jgi:poly(hydroxyalkanoate) granule-associated protein
MAKKPQEPTPEPTSGEFFSFLRKIFLVGVGSMALAQDEAINFLDKLVERGEIAETDARKLVDEMKERRHTYSSQVEEKIEQRLEKLVARLNLPRRDEVQELADRINRLTEKVAEMQKDRTAGEALQKPPEI